MFIFPAPPFGTIEKLQAIFGLLDASVPGYHLDIMDGQFVQNKMGSIELTNQAAQLTEKPLWVHLMVSNPVDYVKQLQLKPESIITAHHEALADQHEVFSKVASKEKLSPSLAVSPKTELDQIFPFLELFDSILIMSVEPGKSGQTFLPSTFERILELHNQIKNRQLHCKILIDGGVTAELISDLCSHTIWAVAVTSTLFNKKEPFVALQNLQKLCPK
jgi:ribulose-phosphate 3-epimerase